MVVPLTAEWVPLNLVEWRLQNKVVDTSLVRLSSLSSPPVFPSTARPLSVLNCPAPALWAVFATVKFCCVSGGTRVHRNASFEPHPSSFTLSTLAAGTHTNTARSPADRLSLTPEERVFFPEWTDPSHTREWSNCQKQGGLRIDAEWESCCTGEVIEGVLTGVVSSGPKIITAHYINSRLSRAVIWPCSA